MATKAQLRARAAFTKNVKSGKFAKTYKDVPGGYLYVGAKSSTTSNRAAAFKEAARAKTQILRDHGFRVTTAVVEKVGRGGRKFFQVFYRQKY